MSLLKMAWTPRSEAQFGEFRIRATKAGKYDEFRLTHNDIVRALRDLDQAQEKGERLFRTKKQGGEVRHWVYKHVSICYTIFPQLRVGWIVSYQPTPASWPT